MPMIMASAVMSTGRRRTKPAFSAALPRIAHQDFKLLAGKAHHQDGVGRGHAHAHDGAGQRRHAEAGPGQEEKPDDSRKGRGQRRDDEKWIEPGLEVDHDEQVDQQDGEGQAAQQADIGRAHGLALAAENETGTARQVFLMAGDDLLHGAGDAAQIGPFNVRVDIDDRLDVVMADFALLGTGDDGGEIRQNLHWFASARARPWRPRSLRRRYAAQRRCAGSGGGSAGGGLGHLRQWWRNW